MLVQGNAEALENPGRRISTLSEDVDIVLEGYFELVQMRVPVKDPVETSNNESSMDGTRDVS